MLIFVHVYQCLRVVFSWQLDKIMGSLGCETVVNGFLMIICSCMRSLRAPLLEAELNRDRKSSLWIFATEIMVRESFSSFSINRKEAKLWLVFLLWFYDFNKCLCASGHITCNPSVCLRAPVLQLSEEKLPDWQQSVQGVKSLSGISTVCAAHHLRQLPSSIPVRWKVMWWGTFITHRGDSVHFNCPATNY